MTHLLDWFCLEGRGYQFWSGIGGDVFLLAPVVWIGKHYNCHERGCWRLGHPHPGTNHRPVCKRHAP